MTRLTPPTAAFLAALALPVLSWGQQQITGGNALDANTQFGGGNVNPGAVVPDFRARNLLITGQVTDGRQFRGDVGYTAPGAFQGALGTDDLFRFRADSYGSSRQLNQVNTVGLGGLNSSSNDLAGGTIIYSGFYNPGVGEVNQPGTVRTVVNSDGTRSARVTAGSSFNPEFVGSGRLASTGLGTGVSGGPEGATRGGILGQPLGLSRNADGNVVRLDASPVLGLRETPLFEIDGSSVPDASLRSPGRLGDDDARRDNRLGDDRAGAGLPDPATPAGTGSDPLRSPATDGNTQTPNLDPNAPRGQTLGQARNTQRTTGRTGENTRNLASNSAIDPAAPRDPLTGLPASLQLGARLTPGMQNAAGRPTAAADQQDAQRITRLGEAIFRPLDATAAESGDSAYLDLLTRIREQYRQGNPNNPEGDAERDEPRRNPLDGPRRPAWMEKIESPEDDLIRKAEESGLSAVATVLRSQRDNNLRANPGQAGKAPDPETAATNAAMAAVIDQLSYDLPRLETLQGQRADRVNTNFAKAEDALAKGRFFEAVSLYEQLMIDAPGNPLARVGLVHAQMGAGLIRSSALQLRRLFEDHPELIATRYAENLLPAQDRVLWLRNELQRNIDDPDQPNAEPGLMIAYLGHQVESEQLVRYGLALALEEKPLDPLLPLLRKVWLGKELDAPQP